MGAESGFSRRGFLTTGAGTALGVAGIASIAAGEAHADTGVPPATMQANRPMIDVPFEEHHIVRVAVIGTGARGLGMLQQFLAVPEFGAGSVRVTAVCDIREAWARQAAGAVEAAGQPTPAIYTAGDYDYENLLARDDVDFVYVATPWEWHLPMAVKAMELGKHVGVETPLATELSHLWKLVDTSERTRRHCLMMENFSYGRNQLRVLRMAHEGLFGELLSASGGYVHDLRRELFLDDYRWVWRRKHLTYRIGDLYSRHGFAPASSHLDINRGDRYTQLVAATTPAESMAAYRAEHMPPDHPTFDEEYVTGDRTISLLETAKGRVVRAASTFWTPHPFSHLTTLTGTKGVFEDYPARIYLEPDRTDHSWGNFEDYAAHDHWMWQDMPGGGGGHGGADFMLIWRLVQSMRLGLVPDIDVYDSATWSVAIALSSESLKRGRDGRGQPVAVPDFTRGNWRQSRPGLDTERPS